MSSQKKKKNATTPRIRCSPCLYNLHIRIACKYTHIHILMHIIIIVWNFTSTGFSCLSAAYGRKNKKIKTLFQLKHRCRSSSYTCVCRLLSVSVDVKNGKLLYDIRQKEKKRPIKTDILDDIYTYDQANQCLIHNVNSKTANRTIHFERTIKISFVLLTATNRKLLTMVRVIPLPIKYVENCIFYPPIVSYSREWTRGTFTKFVYGRWHGRVLEMK